MITVHRMFNLVSACFDVIALSICLSFLLIIAYRLLRAQRRRGQVLIGVLYWGYVLLAFSRFARVIYQRQLWLHRPSLYLFGLMPGHVVIVLIALLPILLAADGVHLVPGEGYCSMLVQPAHYLIYHSTIGFFIPYGILCIFYLWIGRQTRLSSARAIQE